ncbi:hypothetical protein [Parvularcula sp. LCG005]|uniref:hypothetical protein n=1 Tax=Parvularcula sp. LCG005 TaxID=3078805 RepID=UPI002941DCA4|nr:hypothetical protein [Parvularcula sp. LCG005]WOI52125.1 hypothetical protein RUI03_08135 [Parvularcula sp. LCG005]
MFPLPAYRGQTVGVLGLGPQGLAVAEALIESGATVIAFDRSGGVGAHTDVQMRRPTDWPMDQLSAVVIADGDRRGLALTLVDRAAAAGVAVLTDLDLFSQSIDALPPEERPTVIAVTGAAGKSVTVSIIAHILSELGRPVSVGGPIGSPFMDMAAPSKAMTYILELPVRRLSIARDFKPNIAISLSVAGLLDPDQIQMALRSLLKVFKSQGPEDRAIIGVDDALGQELCTMLRSGQCPGAGTGTIIPVSGEAALSHGIFVLGGTAYSAHKRKTQPLGNFSRAPAFVGSHLNQDAAAAIAACLSFDIAPALIIKALHSYKGLKGRFECLGSVGPVMFIDDSFASSTAAAARAIHACPDVFWIGSDAHAPKKGSQVPGSVSSVHGAYLIGDSTDDDSVTCHTGLADAVAAAYRDATKLAAQDPSAAPVILYSPGLPFEMTGIGPNDFRSVVQSHMDIEARYA